MRSLPALAPRLAPREAPRLLLALGLLSSDDEWTTAVDSESLDDRLADLPTVAVSDIDRDGLVFMREEEKLTHRTRTEGLRASVAVAPSLVLRDPVSVAVEENMLWVYSNGS